MSSFAYIPDAADNDDYRVSTVCYLAPGEEHSVPHDKCLSVAHLGRHDRELYDLTIYFSSAVHTHLIEHLTDACPKHDTCEAWYHLVHDLSQLGSGDATTAIETYLSTGVYQEQGGWPWVRPLIDTERCAKRVAQQTEEVNGTDHPSNQFRGDGEEHCEVRVMFTSPNSDISTIPEASVHPIQTDLREISSETEGNAGPSGGESVQTFKIRGCANDVKTAANTTRRTRRQGRGSQRRRAERRALIQSLTQESVEDGDVIR